MRWLKGLSVPSCPAPDLCGSIQPFYLHSLGILERSWYFLASLYTGLQTVFGSKLPRTVPKEKVHMDLVCMDLFEEGCLNVKER